jgi:hypothetical protein
MRFLQLVVLGMMCLAAIWAQGESEGAALKGVVTDPSGAAVPNALVQVQSGRFEKRIRTDENGGYLVSGLKEGKYTIRVIANGFDTAVRREVTVRGDLELAVGLQVSADAQVINVEAEADRLSVDPADNKTGLVLREKELATLSDDPDELEQQLQAMAGPAAGPNGGQIFIDGFSGGRMPPKSSIREVRINANPYSTEYDRPGFGRIEIFTRPGTDNIRGQAFVQFNDESLNSRSPLLDSPKRPQYQQKFYGLNLSGPMRKQKASFGFDFERRVIDENAFILATTLNDQLQPSTLNQAIVTPQTRTTWSPRLDFQLSPKTTLVLRYQQGRTTQEREGVGGFGLSSRAYDQKDSDHTLQLTATRVISATVLNETRIQYQRINQSQLGDNSTPAIQVSGAFQGGGAQVGNSGTETARQESNNVTSIVRNRHTFKFGGRIRRGGLDDTSVNNFGGTYTFFGGAGPELDANDQAIAGTSVPLSALERYRRTLLFQNLGYSASQIRALGGGASQFSLNAGTALTEVNQVDAGLFFNDDWRISPNLTLSYGVRYEFQTNLSDRANWAPRIGLAWGLGGKGGTPVKTVLRAGFGVFYDRVNEQVTLQAQRFNGLTQQSYLVQDPDFFPGIPSLETLGAAQQPQQLQLVDTRLQAPRNYQASVGIERQINAAVRVTMQYMHNRGVHLLRSRNINTPTDGVYPYGDSQLRILTESTGSSRQNMLLIAPNINYKKLFLFSLYVLSYGKSDNEGSPADPYNLRAEWGPSSFADVRHRLVLGTSLPLPWRLTASPFVLFTSGTPYNITTGRDVNGDGFTSERPALLSNVSANQCQGGSLRYSAEFGCFDLNPAPGTSIGRNYGRGPINFNVNLRLARTWSFGNRGESGPSEMGPPAGMGGLRGPGGMPGGGPPPGVGPGGGPGGLFGAASGKKYNLTLSISARNLFNRANYAAPNGDLSSPFFGNSLSLAGLGPLGGASTYNRKVDLQLRFTF